MANFVSDAYRNNVLGDNTYANVQLDADTIAAMFIDNADDTIIAANGDLAAVASAARVPAAASCPSLASKTTGTVGVGVFDAADTVFTSLTGDASEQLLLFKNTGTDSTAILLACYDTATGLPLTPNGGNVTVVWSASGIFSF